MKSIDVDLNNPAHPGHSDYLISSEGRQAEQMFYHHTPLLESCITELLNELYHNKEEQCGFITKEFDIFKIKNSHLNPRHNFYMTEEDAAPVIDSIYQKRATEVLGVWHTHPNNYPWPTPRDIVGWPNPALGWRYFLVTRGTVTEWRLISD